MNKFIKCLSAILCGVGALFAVSKVNAYTISSEYGYTTIKTNNLCPNTNLFVGYINANGVLSDTNQSDTLNTDYIYLRSGTYTISSTLPRVQVNWYNDTNSSSYVGGIAWNTFTFTLNDNYYVRIGINNQSDMYYNGVSYLPSRFNLMLNSGSSALPYEPYGEFIDINSYEKVISGYLTTASNIYWSNTWASENYITSYPMYVNESVSNDNYDASSLIDSINNSQLVLANFQPWLPSGISSSRRVVNGAGFGSCTYLFEDLSSINLLSFTTFQFEQNNSLTNQSAFYFEYVYNNISGSVNLTYQDLITKYGFNYNANNLFEHSFYQLIVDNLGYEPSVIPTITRFSYSYDSLSDTYGFGYFNMLNVNGYSQGYESGYNTASNDKQKVIDRLQNSYNSLQDAYNSLDTRFKSLQELYDSYINDNVTLDSLIWNIATTPFETFKTIWDVDILGVNLGSLCVGLMFVGIALYIWRKFV